MSNIAAIDKNFEVKTQIEKDDIKFYNINESPFEIYGVFLENGKYRRIPEKVAQSVSEAVYILHSNTSGGRVRFITDSSYIAISARLDGLERMSHFTFAGSMGFDMYNGNRHIKTFVPPVDMTDGYENVAELGTKELRNITINFPLYCNVKELYIGISSDAIIREPTPYTYRKPIVYYGSSITQGGCASRPGMSYPGIISRRFDCDFINLGFSGSAKAEEEMIEYIKNIDMSVFVYDYDFNAPTIPHLKNTHKKMFDAVRSEKPDVPIIIMPRPRYYLREFEKERLQIVEETYKSAVSSGDKNVYFIDGKSLMALCEDSGTVDCCHPNDYGFVSMAAAVGDLIEKNSLL